MDVRRGSGAFPFLRSYGSNSKLSERTEDDKPVTRIRVTPTPPKPAKDESWDAIALGLAGADGWFRPGTNGHSFLYITRDPDTLVVTFDNLDIAMTKL